MSSAQATAPLSAFSIKVGAISHRAWQPALTLLASDATSLILAFFISIATWNAVVEDFPLHFYLEHWPLIVVFFAAYSGVGLYKVVAIPPVEELRRAVLATSGAFSFIVCWTFLLKASAEYSRGVTVLAWFSAVVFVPMLRLVLRPLLARTAWFSQPAAIIGARSAAQGIVSTLRQAPILALRPVLAFGDDTNGQEDVEGVPIAGDLSSAVPCCKQLKIDYAVIALQGLSREDLPSILRTVGSGFKRLLIVPDLFGISSVCVGTRDLGGVLGLEIRNNLLQPWSAGVKRVLDLVLVLALFPLVLPLSLVVAAIVRMTSAGPAVYGQRRIGRYGQEITVWKFRTMVSDADSVLAKCLETNPYLKAEWDRDHKLKADPRITAVGSFLRRTSLDELPQLWNVLTGDMSLVGPRPIVSAEISRFGTTFDYYARVLPGITGPWQVSGRNRLSYEERVRLNEYYVRNWSVWLDVYILFRTVGVVVKSDGAY